MSGLLYHIRELSVPPNDEMLVEHGLDSIFDAKRDVAIIEGGRLGAGVIVTRPGSLGEYRPRYRPDEQTWQTFGDVSIGYYNAARPDPDIDLGRPKSLRGRRVELADGEEWVVPELRRADEGEVVSVTPSKMTFDGVAWQRGSVVDRFAAIDDKVSTYLEKWREAYESVPVGGVFDGIEWPTAIPDAVEVLSANYRIGNREASLLGLFTEQDEAQVVLQAAASIPVLAAWITYRQAEATQKKSTMAEPGSITSDGNAA